MKRQLELGNQIDFVGGDGLYGNDYSLMNGLDELGLTGVLDVHQDQQVFFKVPIIAIPETKEGRGRTATKYKTASKAIEVRELKKQLILQQNRFEETDIRQGTKGTIKSKVAVINIYTRDDQSADCKQRQLLVRISETANGNEEVKYALSNAKSGQYTSTQIAQMQAQRYYEERAFQECKSDIGMSEYQVRGWRAWHHHMAMCMMAQAYILNEKKEHQEEIPQLSDYDIRQEIMQTFIRKDNEYDEVKAQIRYRHKQRNNDFLRRNNKT